MNNTIDIIIWRQRWNELWMREFDKLPSPDRIALMRAKPGAQVSRNFCNRITALVNQEFKV